MRKYGIYQTFHIFPSRNKEVFGYCHTLRFLRVEAFFTFSCWEGAYTMHTISMFEKIQS